MSARAASTEATRDRIIAAMLALLMERWYDEVTLRDLADHAGVALQTVVNHFSTKEGVLAALLEDPRLLAQFAGARFSDEPEDVRAAGEVLVRDHDRAGV